MHSTINPAIHQSTPTARSHPIITAMPAIASQKLSRYAESLPAPTALRMM